MLGEFLSSNVSTPFLLFMVKGTPLHSESGLSLTMFSLSLGFGFPDEADAAFWTGILGKRYQYRHFFFLHF